MENYGQKNTWKIVYTPKEMMGGVRGVAFVEGEHEQAAIRAFKQLYEGQYSFIDKCDKVF